MPLIQTEDHGEGVRVLRLDNGKANAISTQMTTHTCSKPGAYRCEGVECGDNAKGDRFKGIFSSQSARGHIEQPLDVRPVRNSEQLLEEREVHRQRQYPDCLKKISLLLLLLHWRL